MPPEIEDAVTQVPAAESAAPAPAVAEAPRQDDAKPAEPQSLLDAAMSALQGPEKATVAPDATATAEPPSGEAAPAGEKEAPGEAPEAHHIPAEEFKLLPKSTKDAVIALRKELKQLRPAADKAAAVDEYLRATGVTPDEFADGQETMALMKRGDPKALERLEGYVARLRKQLGHELPDDLKQDVDQGYISEERALQLSQAQARADAAQRAVEQVADDRAAQAVMSEVVAWETATKAADPDFGRKLPLVQERVKLMILERGAAVRNPADGLKLVQDAYAHANKVLRDFAPAPAPTRPSPTSAASAPARAVAPASIYEAARRALGTA